MKVSDVEGYIAALKEKLMAEVKDGKQIIV